MFDEIDTGDNHLISLDEFEKKVPQLQTWGVSITDARATFGTIDRDGDGAVTFEEFQKWATRVKLDRDDDDDPAGISPRPKET